MHPKPWNRNRTYDIERMHPKPWNRNRMHDSECMNPEPSPSQSAAGDRWL